MRTEAHVSVVPATVNGHDVWRCAAARVAQGRAFGIATGLGMPRTWQRAAAETLEGFRDGMETTDHGGIEVRLKVSFHEAHRRLHDHSRQLVERTALDSGLLAVALDNGMLFGRRSGPGRIYLHRKGTPTRLSPRTVPDQGLSHHPAERCAIELEPGDLILLGTEEAFSVRSVGQLSSVLAADHLSPAPVLANLLTEPANSSGLGAAAIVLRVA